MKRRSAPLLLVVAASLGIFWSCQPPMGEPVLDLTMTPKAIDDRGQVAKVEVVGTDGAGKIGAGSVTITSAAGSLADGQTLQFDAYGKATTTFSCDVALDDRCSGQVRLVAEWTSKGVPVTAELRATVGPVSGTGGGTGGSGGGSMGTGGGTGGGPTGKVMVVGSAGAGMGVAQLGSPTNFRVGLGGSLYHVIIRPNGRIAYIKEQPLAFLDFIEDQYVRTTTGSGLPNVLANDTVIPTPPCGTPAQLFTIGEFWVRPDSSNIVYQCGLMTRFRYEGGTELPQFDGFELLSLGPGEAALMTDTNSTVVRSPSGVNTTSTFPRITWGKRDVRSRPDGFWVYSGTTTTCGLSLLKFDGTVQVEGSYAELPAGVTIPASATFCSGKIDGDGSLLTIAEEAGLPVVVRRPLAPGTASVAYSTAGQPARDFTVYPPRTYVTPEFLIATP